MRNCLLVTALVMSFFSAIAQENKSAEEKEAAYIKTITVRAEKIVDALKLSDSVKAHRVATIVAGQYKNLNSVYAKRDEQVKSIKEKGGEKDAINAQLKNTEDATAQAIQELHKTYLAALAKELSPEQIVAIKDGMTYGIVSVTYRAYSDMIPTLTNDQKEQIMKWLVEARELAMDAESSEKKHWWFGKYKGRINNYLTAAGYDLKKEGDQWEARRKANAAKSGQ